MPEDFSQMITTFSHESWRQEAAGVMIRLYAPIPGLEPWLNDFLTFMARTTEPKTTAPISIFGVVRMKDFSYFPAESQIHFSRDNKGRLVPKLFAAQKKLPDTPHFFISAPMKDDSKASEDETMAQLDTTVGIFKACFGRTIAWSLAWQGLVNFSNDTTTHTSKAHELPHHVDYPIQDRVWQICFREILEKLSSLSQEDEQKLRVTTAMGFIEKGSADSVSSQRFISLWMGIEILLNGKARHLANTIGKIYQISTREAQTKFLIEDIKNSRDDLMHYGRLPDFDKPALRYLEYCLIEIARHELGLPCLRILEQALNNPNFDLISISSA